MGRFEVRFSNTALDDLRAIHHRILAESRCHDRAVRYIARLVAICERIGDTPLDGPPRDDVEPGIRTWPFERRIVVVYRLEPETVLEPGTVSILNLFHSARSVDIFYDEPLTSASYLR